MEKIDLSIPNPEKNSLGLNLKMKVSFAGAKVLLNGFDVGGVFSEKGKASQSIKWGIFAKPGENKLEVQATPCPDSEGKSIFELSLGSRDEEALWQRKWEGLDQPFNESFVLNVADMPATMLWKDNQTPKTLAPEDQTQLAEHLIQLHALLKEGDKDQLMELLSDFLSDRALVEGGTKEEAAKQFEGKDDEAMPVAPLPDEIHFEVLENCPCVRGKSLSGTGLLVLDLGFMQLNLIPFFIKRNGQWSTIRLMPDLASAELEEMGEALAETVGNVMQGAAQALGDGMREAFNEPFDQEAFDKEFPAIEETPEQAPCSFEDQALGLLREISTAFQDLPNLNEVTIEQAGGALQVGVAWIMGLGVIKERFDALAEKLNHIVPDAPPSQPNLMMPFGVLNGLKQSLPLLASSLPMRGLGLFSETMGAQQGGAFRSMGNIQLGHENFLPMLEQAIAALEI